METSLSSRQRIKVWLVATHLVLVCLFILGASQQEATTPVGVALRTYRNVIGLFRDYSFFAPKVAADVRAGFLLEKDREASQFLPIGDSRREVERRLSCMVGSAMHSQAARSVLARSWAAWAMGQHPDVSKVTVVAQTFELPSLRAYAAGERPYWKTFFAADFARAEVSP